MEENALEGVRGLTDRTEAFRRLPNCRSELEATESIILWFALDICCWSFN
jgi:hypothetical protein